MQAGQQQAHGTAACSTRGMGRSVSLMAEAYQVGRGLTDSHRHMLLDCTYEYVPMNFVIRPIVICMITAQANRYINVHFSLYMHIPLTHLIIYAVCQDMAQRRLPHAIPHNFRTTYILHTPMHSFTHVIHVVGLRTCAAHC
jgi:hypothetical protein